MKNEFDKQKILRSIIKLKRLSNNFNEDELIDLENSFFKKYSITNEMDKIKLEIAYVEHLIEIENKSYSKRDYNKTLLRLIKYAVETHEKLGTKDLSTIKNAILNIEIVNDYSTHFYSEIKNINFDEYENKYNKKGDR